MVYYLKINRTDKYTYDNLKHWLEVISYDDLAIIYIICDKNELTSEVKKQLNCEKAEFIHSEYNSEELNDIVTNGTISNNWEKAAYAHLTTFWHAKKQGYNDFWNIDADDTYMMLSPKRCFEVLNEAKKMADENNIGIFSLDMWFSRTGGHWTFGITYTNGCIDWVGILRKNDFREAMEKMKQPRNLDGCFTVLKYRHDEKIESFYVENMRFIHYGYDFIRQPWSTGIWYWENDKLIFPILEGFAKIDAYASIPIDKRVKKIDIGVTKNEIVEQFFANANQSNRYALKRNQERWIRENDKIKLVEKEEQKNVIYRIKNKIFLMRK